MHVALAEVTMRQFVSYCNEVKEFSRTCTFVKAGSHKNHICPLFSLLPLRLLLPLPTSTTPMPEHLDYPFPVLLLLPG